MQGQLGDDTYVVDDAGDSVIEWGGEGIDTVESSISHSLAIYTENLTLTGASNINGTGNGEDNVITGNSGNNTLTGNGGNDTLDGGAGADTLTGGTGDDTYIFSRGDNADTIDNAGESASADVLEFGATIDHDQLWFEQVGNDLKVSVIGSADSVTVDEWFTGTSNRLDFEGGDAYTLTDTNVQALVNAMASFSPPSVGDTELSDAFSGQNLTDLNSVIAGNWQA